MASLLKWLSEMWPTACTSLWRQVRGALDGAWHAADRTLVVGALVCRGAAVKVCSRLFSALFQPSHPGSLVTCAACRSAVSVTAGQLRNQTVLPLPPVGEAELTSGAPSKEALHLLEAALVTWTRQIKTVLLLDPEA